ncbi:MAG: hypothetical protein ACE5LS_02660 [Thermoplasmata archaeon]
MAEGTGARSRVPRPRIVVLRQEPPRGGRPWHRQVLAYLLVVTVLIIALALLSPGSSDLRFAVLVWVLLVAGVLVFLLLYRRAVRVPPLEAPVEGERVVRGELGRLAETLGRAERGMRFSQVVVARRVRQAFLLRMQYEHGLSGEELDALLADPAEFARLVRDPMVRAFLEDTAPTEDALIRRDAPGTVSAFRFTQGRSFTAGIARVLEAMEAWQ